MRRGPLRFPYAGRADRYGVLAFRGGIDATERIGGFHVPERSAYVDRPAGAETWRDWVSSGAGLRHALHCRSGLVRARRRIVPRMADVRSALGFVFGTWAGLRQFRPCRGALQRFNPRRPKPGSFCARQQLREPWKRRSGLLRPSGRCGSLSAAAGASVDGMSIDLLYVEPSENRTPDLPTARGRVY